MFPWTRLFKRDPLALMGPGLRGAPERCIGLSGTKLCFTCPEQSTQMSFFMGGDEFDIEKAPRLQGQDTEITSAMIYASGWDFHDRALAGNAYGSLLLDVVLLGTVKTRDKNQSLFKKNELEQWVFYSTELLYGKFNRRMLEKADRHDPPIEAERDLWQYPKRSDDLQWQTFNGQRWVRYETFQPEHQPVIVFETAVSHQHVVRMNWSPGAYHGRDYFSPRHNLRAATTAMMQGMMDSMRIEWSDEARRQRTEAGID